MKCRVDDLSNYPRYIVLIIRRLREHIVATPWDFSEDVGFATPWDFSEDVGFATPWDLSEDVGFATPWNLSEDVGFATPWDFSADVGFLSNLLSQLIGKNKVKRYYTGRLAPGENMETWSLTTILLFYIKKIVVENKVYRKQPFGTRRRSYQKLISDQWPQDLQFLWNLCDNFGPLSDH